MPLDRQNVPISLRGGVDTKTDPKQVVAGKLLTLENGVFTSPGRIRKRNGYASIASVSGTSYLAAEYGNTLAVGANGSLYADTAAGLAAVGDYFPISLTRTPLLRTQSSLSNHDGALESVSGLYCLVTGSYAYLYDSATWVLRATVQIDSSMTSGSARVNALAGKFVISYRVPVAAIPTLRYRTIDPATPGTISAATSISDGVTTLGARYDACLSGAGASAQIVFAFSYGSAANLKVRALSATFVLSAVTTITTASEPLNLGAFANGTDTVIGYIIAANSHHFSVVNAALTATVSDRTLGSPPTNSGTNYTLSGWSDTNGVYPALSYTYTDGTNTIPLLVFWPINTDYSLPGGLTYHPVYGIALGSRPFSWQGHNWFVAYFRSVSQQRAFLLRADKLELQDSATGYLSSPTYARLLSDGAGIPDNSQPPASIATSGNAILFPGLSIVRSSTQSTTLSYSQQGVDMFALDAVAGQAASLATEAGGTLHLNGGQLWHYDGANVVEHGFNVYPEITSAVAANGGAGPFFPAGTYQYVIVFEWMDNQGRFHRSSPSVPVSVVHDGTKMQTNFVLPSLRLTAKAGVEIVIYRTIAGGTVLYRTTGFGTQQSQVSNQSSLAWTTCSDVWSTATDTMIQSQPTVYTTGNVLPDLPAPACSSMVMYRNRLVAVNAENPNQIVYSKQIVPGYPAEFAGLLAQNIDPTGGSITGLAALDDKLILFKGSVVFFMTGDGPSDTGTANDFSTPILINTNSGCVDPRSVFTAADGVMYKSAKGFFLLDRALQDHYVGAEVESYNSQTVTGGAIIPGANEVRYTLSGGVALMYDYLVKQWSVFTGINAASACIHGGKFTYVTAAGAVMQESPGTFTDNGAVFALKLQTGWLSLAGLQGYQRVYKLLVLGDYFSAHTLEAQVAVDYDSTIVQSVNFQQLTSSMYQWRLDLTRQKCQAIQFTLQEIPGATGEGLALSSLTLEIGAKRGPFRPAAARIGS